MTTNDAGDWCCLNHGAHKVRWIEHPVFGSCGEGWFIVVACCTECPIAGKTATWKVK